MQNCGFDQGLIKRFATELGDSGQPSVDAFLDQHKSNTDYEKLGKAAIAASLIPQEERPKLFDKKTLRLYEYIWHASTATPGTYSSNRLSILTFNYDRSFEEYLQTVLAASHPEFHDRTLLDQALSQFDVIHLYGSLGSLNEKSRHFLAYGGGPNHPPLPPTVLSAAERIKLYHQAKFDDRDTLERIRLRINEAEKICFLGFGFHPMNIRLLQFCGLGENKTTKHFASAYDLKEGERESKRQLLSFDIEFSPEGAKSLDALRMLPVLG